MTELKGTCGCKQEDMQFLHDDMSIVACSTRSLVHETFKCNCGREWRFDYHWTDQLGSWVDVFEIIGENKVGSKRYSEEYIQEHTSPTIRLGVPCIYISTEETK